MIKLKCKKCNEILEPDAQFCHGCGNNSEVKTTIHAIDIGGSSVKSAEYEFSDYKAISRKGDVVILDKPDWLCFEQWLKENISITSRFLSISSSGFVDLTTGINHRFSIAGWRDYPLKERIQKQFPHISDIWCLNDAEAHLFAQSDEVAHPCLSLSLGTSPGIAVSDHTGNIFRTRPDYPLEFGGLRPRSRSDKKEVWALCSTKELISLQKEMGQLQGTQHFGYRVGALLAQLAGIFQVRTVVVSGGIIEHNQKPLWTAIKNEFINDLPAWLKESPPQLICSKYAREAGLVGAARYGAFHVFK